MSAIQPSDATRRRDRIKLLLGTMVDTKEKVLVLITEAKENDDHVALGFQSWTAYVSTEYADLLADLNREDRRFAAFALSQTGMSTRAIAPIVGVTDRQVRYDIGQVGNDFPPDEDACPGPQPLVITNSGRPGTTRMVTGLDGKAYIAATPVKNTSSKTMSSQRRKPLPDAFHDATYDLGKIGTRLENLHKDDRFPEHRDKVRRYRADLFRAQTILRKLIADLGDVQAVPLHETENGLSLVNDIRLYLTAMSGSAEVARLTPAGKQRTADALRAAAQQIEDTK